ncbi:hypothetical protein BDC45DRAFT_245996 [Circinella umbellata]|nr:hypothetical protein BDC45DRAFT_245996 [Circinella umbellata]
MNKVDFFSLLNNASKIKYTTRDGRSTLSNNKFYQRCKNCIRMHSITSGEILSIQRSL